MDDQTTRVLLIEDKAGEADLIRLRLVEGQSPVRVDCVNRLSDGLAWLTKEMPSLVLLDLNLLDSHGAETFRRVLKHAPNMPVVVLSGQDDEALAINAVHRGVQDYLIKGDVTSKLLGRAIPYAVERQALLPRLKSARSRNSSSRTNFCPTYLVSCALRSLAFTSTSRCWMDWLARLRRNRATTRGRS
jgi:sigma-B regulation protein RsbU (phosphoserine phosphatase)